MEEGADATACDCCSLLSALSSRSAALFQRSSRALRVVVLLCLSSACMCVCLCASVSRNFNHVLKTINMYTFKPAEVTALEEGGNKKARKYWLHFFDADNPREYKVDMDDAKSVLEFMKLKYEQKKWCIEQPKKEEPKKEKGEGKKKKGKKAADDDEHDAEPAAAHSREGEPSKEKADHRRVDSEALKLKEPAKGDKEKQRSRKSTGSAAPATAGGEGQSKAGGSSAGGLDFLSSLDNLSFAAPSAAPSGSAGGFGGGGGFGSDDFGGGGFGDSSGGFGSSAGGFGSSSASAGGFGGGGGSGFNADFDAGFGSSSASTAANGHSSFAVQSAPNVASSGGSGGLSSLVEQAQSVKVHPQAVSCGRQPDQNHRGAVSTRRAAYTGAHTAGAREDCSGRGPAVLGTSSCRRRPQGRQGAVSDGRVR